MELIEDIIGKLNKLEDGYLVYKIRNGKKYCYLQKRVGSTVTSTYIREDDIQMVEDNLLERNYYESILKRKMSEGKNMPIPSKMAFNLTGDLMMENVVAASFENGELTYLNEEICPLYIKRTKSIEGYLKLRTIDNTRTNSRLLKKALGIKEEDKMSLYAYGASITDNYWFRAKHSKLKYEDICFDNDFYSDLALKGQLIIYPKSPKLTPELTTPGSYEKCWKKVIDDWYLYKKGSSEEIFSELFCYLFAKSIGVPTAEYEYYEGYIRTRNFADTYNFEPMVSIASDNDDYEHVFECLCMIDETLAKDYIRLIYFDTLINNIDRHNENCGLLRDKKTGEIIGLAPNFDNNLALVSRTMTLNTDAATDGFVKLFVNFIKNNHKAKELFGQIELNRITRSAIIKCFDQIPIKADAEIEDMIIKYILNRFEYLKKLQK